jgi:cell division septal protein FtsQ
MSKNSRYRSSTFAQKQRRRKIFKRIIWSIFVFAVISGLSYWSGHHSITINSITISENEFLNNEKIIENIEKQISGRYLFLFSKKNSLLIPRSEVKNSIIKNNLSVSEVSLKVRDINNLFVDISEHEPVAKWCDEANNCFLINAEGLIYTQEKVLNPKNVIKVSGVFENSNDILGKTYLNTETFKSILKTVENLNQLSIKPTLIDTEDQETIAIETMQGPYLLIDRNDNPADVLNNLQTVIETEEINEAQFKNLEYIDLRFGNKVYYKIK